MRNLLIFIAIILNVPETLSQKIDVVSETFGEKAISAVHADPFGEGTGIYGEGYRGVWGKSQNGFGLVGESDSHIGLSVVSNSSLGAEIWSWNSHAAIFSGNVSEGFADIILGGRGPDDYDGVIMNDPDYSFANLHLISNKDLIVRLDKDLDDDGNFEIRNSLNRVVLKMIEDGTFEVWNGALNNNRRLLLQPDGDLFIDGTLTQGSSSLRKDNVQNIRREKVLQTIMSIPIYEWQYKGQLRRHIGPMAEDFNSAFKLEGGDAGIAAIDVDGIVLAGIQALKDENDLLKELINNLSERIERLESN